ncbi:MAG: helix-turn-helix transcriptional regulator [Candidatus Nitronauta litoralis]|uniref:Helix-turn-helix transcriptional regulator n=1 Tax=Candidatus Nitronauta litoralis TaxID=2705533 RepID=A0A7T0BTN6_9BACT|nr:MAG: helix-turn-helix transcriptional regulator [Candidatus Nitronauta litoralis]
MDNSKNKKLLLGQRLKLWRKEHSLKGNKLAKDIGISPGSLSEIENGNCLPSAETLSKLHEFTNLDVLWLLTGKGDMNKGQAEIIRTGEYENLDQAQFGIDPKILHDEKLKGLVEKLVKIYTSASPVQKANILGYLSGVDHQN